MTPEQILADYRASIARVGEEVLIRRYIGTGPARTFVDATVRARVTAYDPQAGIGAIQQGDQKLIVLAEDMAFGGIVLPLVKGDKAIVRGRELNIEAADDNTRRVAGVLIAYELLVRG